MKRSIPLLLKVMLLPILILRLTLTLILILVAGVCNVALAQFDRDAQRQQEDARRREEAAARWRTLARNIIAEADRTKRAVKPIWQSDAPAGASAKYKLAWNYWIRKAKEVHFACENLIQRAEMIERGDLSKQSLDELSTLIHKYRLAWNEYREAQTDVERAQWDEPRAGANEEPPLKRSRHDRKQPPMPRQRPQQQ